MRVSEANVQRRERQDAERGESERASFRCVEIRRRRRRPATRMRSSRRERTLSLGYENDFFHKSFVHELSNRKSAIRAVADSIMLFMFITRSQCNVVAAWVVTVAANGCIKMNRRELGRGTAS